MRTGDLLLVLTVAAAPAGAARAQTDQTPAVPATAAGARALASGGGPRVDLSQLSDPAALERTLRDLLPRTGLPRLSLPGGRAYLGDFGLGSLDTLRGHLLVLRGSAHLFGHVTGNVVTLDGDVVVGPGGSVAGDALALGGDVRAPGDAVVGETKAYAPVRPAPAATGAVRLPVRAAGLVGVFLTLMAIGFGLVTFARPSLEIVSDTVRVSLGRAFLVGLLAEILVVPTFGMLVVGLALTVVGVLLIPFAVAAYVLIVLATAVMGMLAVAHAMGEAHTRRRMALGVILSPNSYRYILVGLGGVLAVWLIWLLFGWVPFAGGIVLAAAVLVTWLLATVGFGASLLSRVGLRPDFAGRIVPQEALTDEYLWATPQFGVPAAKRPEKPPARDQE